MSYKWELQMMIAQNVMHLQCVQLKTPQEWIYRRDELSFVFPKNGVGECVSGSITHRLMAGDVLVLNATSSGNKILSTERGEMIFWCFSLRLEHLFPLFSSSEICLLQNVTEGFKNTKLYKANSPLAKECHQLLSQIPSQFTLNHRSHLLRVAAVILTVEFSAAQSQRIGFYRPEDHLQQIFGKLSTFELLGLSVGELANKFGYSRRHLNRLFHQFFGVSIAALRMEMRLLKALSLLRNPDTKVIQVADACGFNQLGLFNICFKRRFRTSPSQWRKIYLETYNTPTRPETNGQVCRLRADGMCPWSKDTCHAISDLPPGRTISTQATDIPSLITPGLRNGQLLANAEQNNRAAVH